MDVQLIKTARQPTAVVHETVPMEQLKDFFARAFGEVAGALAHQGVAPAGPPFALYFGMPGETVELEVGFPVAQAVEEEGPVHTASLPGGPAAKSVHVGPYETMGDTYNEMSKWMGEYGLKPHEEMWEVYLSDPQLQPDPSDWHTEVYWPVD